MCKNAEDIIFEEENKKCRMMFCAFKTIYVIIKD